MIWWIENPARSAAERLSVENLAGSVDWLQVVGLRLDGVHLCWDVDIVTPRRTYPVTLRYPDHFPSSPALVFPRDVEERWSFHQYGPGGELCLEFGPDNWHPDFTGADMLQSAHRLLSGEEQFVAGGPEVGSRHKESLGQELRTRSNRVLIPSGAQEMIASLAEYQVISGTVVVMYREASSTFILSTAGEGEAEWKAILPAALLASHFSLDAKLIRWPEALTLPRLEDISAFRDVFQGVGINISGGECLIVVKGPKIAAFDLALSPKVNHLAVILDSPSSSRLDADHLALAKRKIAVVGCGSLGSKVATMLARSGVRQFVLVDDDILFPENLGRNDLDWRDITLHKVDGLADKLQFVNPMVICQRYRRSLGGQESSSNIETLVDVLGTCDLLIDATADTLAFNYLCSVAGFARRPMIWGEVFGGGYGGLISRSRPQLEPDPASIRQAILHWSNEQGRIVQPASGRYNGGEETPAIADDVEVSVIASHLALLAIDTLMPRNPSAYRYAVYMIGLRAGWVFDQAFDVRPLDVGALPVETYKDVSIEEQRAEVKRVLKLIADYPNGNTAAS